MERASIDAEPGFADPLDLVEQILSLEGYVFERAEDNEVHFGLPGQWADLHGFFAPFLTLGAEPHDADVGPMELHIPAIKGIGGSVIYLIDRYGDRSIYDVDFVPTDPARGFEHLGAGLTEIDIEAGWP